METECDESDAQNVIFYLWDRISGYALKHKLRPVWEDAALRNFIMSTVLFTGLMCVCVCVNLNHILSHV